MIRVNRLFLLGMIACAVAFGMSCQGSTGVPNTPADSGSSRPSNPSKAPGVGDAAAIRGVWLLVRLEENGEEAGPEAIKGKKYVIGDELVMHMTRSQPLDFQYKLDAAAVPKAIDLTLKDRPEVVLRGIYKLEGDELVVCLAKENEDRPKDFTAPADSDRKLLRFKKAP